MPFAPTPPLFALKVWYSGHFYASEWISWPMEKCFMALDVNSLRFEDEKCETEGCWNEFSSLLSITCYVLMLRAHIFFTNLIRSTWKCINFTKLSFMSSHLFPSQYIAYQLKLLLYSYLFNVRMICKSVLCKYKVVNIYD